MHHRTSFYILVNKQQKLLEEWGLETVQFPPLLNLKTIIIETFSKNLLRIYWRTVISIASFIVNDDARNGDNI